MTSDESEIFSCALQHKSYHKDFVTFVYFTQSEWDRVIDRRDALFRKAKKLLEKDEDEEEWRRKAGEWYKEEKQNMFCSCKAHECDPRMYMEVVAHLVTISHTDDTGSVLATRFLPYIIKKGDLNHTFVRSTRAGTFGRNIRYCKVSSLGQLERQ